MGRSELMLMVADTIDRAADAELPGGIKSPSRNLRKTSIQDLPFCFFCFFCRALTNANFIRRPDPSFMRKW